MLDYLSEESTADVLGVMLSHGFRATKDQVSRWRVSGLLPRAHQRGIGRGSIALHPPATGLQAVAVFQELWRERSFETALWSLWQRSFRVDETLLRSFLREKLDHLASQRDRLLAAADRESGDPEDIVDEIGKRARGARLENKALARMRRALGREPFANLAHLLILVLFGLIEHPSVFKEESDLAQTIAADAVEDLSLLGKAFGRELSRDEVTRMWGAFEPDQLGSALEHASLPDFELARDRTNIWVNYWKFWTTPERIWNVENAYGKRYAELIELTCNDVDFDSRVGPFLFLVLLAQSSSAI
jgi:hypothetical protein